MINAPPINAMLRLFKPPDYANPFSNVNSDHFCLCECNNWKLDSDCGISQIHGS